MSDDWTEKYRPKSLSEIIGNPGAAKTMKDWAESWKSGIPEKRALLLVGTPGIGKTSAQEALAKEMDWAIIEMNASDQRTGNAIKNVAFRASKYETFGADGSFLSSSEGRMKLIVLDEADCLYGNADRGAMPVINDLIKTTIQPLILIANDGYALLKKSQTIKEKTLQIQFRKPTAESVSKAIKNVCKQEGIEIAPEAATAIAENQAGDIRAALRDLQSLAVIHNPITLEHTKQLSGREERYEMFDVVSAIYRRRDPVIARERFMQADTDPDTLLLWLSENMQYECSDSGDLVRVSEKLARADVYLGRVKKRMHYGFLSYATDIMINGVPDQIKKSQPPRDRIRFPNYLVRMSRTKGARALRDSAQYKLGLAMHTSSSRVISNILPQMRISLANDQGLRRWAANTAELEPDELAFIIGVTSDKKIIKEAYEAEEEPVKKSVKKTVEELTPEPTPVSAPAKNQKNLFDFGS